MVDWLFISVLAVWAFVNWWFWLSPWSDRRWKNDRKDTAPTEGGTDG